MSGSTGSTENVDLVGNTNPNPKRDSPKLHYILTINNYTTEDKEKLNGSNIINIAVAQTEIGEKGTKHIQAYIKMNKKVRFKTIKDLFPTAHIEAVTNVEAAIDYCQKEDTATGEWELFRNTYKKEVLKLIEQKDLNSSQLQLVNEIKSFNGEFRKILWCLDYKGGFGKSLIAKYFYDQEHALILNGGKANDINFILKEYIDKRKPIKTIIFDIPRCSIEYINYAAIENIYNGLISCNKYESCILRYNPPKKIIVFANEEPEYEKLSKGRIQLRILKNN